MKDGPAGDDRKLVARVARKDGRALEELYARFGDAVYRYLLTFVADRRIAEEVLQDTFVAAWRGASNYKGRSSVKTWLFGIARRRAHEALRRRALPVVSDDELVEPADPELDPADSLLASARREEIAARVERLSPAHREVLTLTFFHGLSYAETAEVAGVPIGTVKSRLANARRALKGLLKDSGYER